MVEQEHTRYGTMFMPKIGDDLICRFLCRYGEWAFNEARFTALNIPAGGRVLDIGAFLGTFGLGVGLEQQLDRICFVEANPAIIPYLRRNVELNCRCSAVVIEGIVTSSANPFSVGHYDRNNLSSLSFAESFSSGGGSKAEIRTNVPSLSLLQLRSEQGPFDLIKIDAEGMELDILKGDPEMFTRPDTALWLECNEKHGSLELAELLLNKDYRVFYFAFPSYSVDNFLGSSDPIFPFAFEAGLFCTLDRTPRLDDRLFNNGCVLLPIEATEDLRRAMWQTPRWGPRQWLGCTIDEIVALAGHAIRGEPYETFLRDPGPAAENIQPADLHLMRVLRLEGALAEAKKRESSLESAFAASEMKLAGVEQLMSVRHEEAQKQLRGLEEEKARLSSLLTQTESRIATLTAAQTRTAALVEGQRALLAAARAAQLRAETQLERVDADRNRELSAHPTEPGPPRD